MGLPAAQGLYDPRFEHDACGLGFVATLKRTATHDVVKQALKILDPNLAEDDVAKQRFCREARAAASITHENVVAVHQVENALLLAHRDSLREGRICWNRDASSPRH